MHKQQEEKDYEIELPKDFLLFLLILTSSASSKTKFMYSSKPCQP